MSNCISFHPAKNKLLLNAEQIDIPRILADVERVSKGKSYPVGDDVPVDDYLMWWFLTPRNVSLFGNILEICFAGGHSIHTWRDFQGTLRVIAKYLKPLGMHTWKTAIIDEDAGDYDDFGPMTVVFDSINHTAELR